jgi:hypothetical protein
MLMFLKLDGLENRVREGEFLIEVYDWMYMTDRGFNTSE